LLLDAEASVEVGRVLEGAVVVAEAGAELEAMLGTNCIHAEDYKCEVGNQNRVLKYE
jgi:hypothetical protein